jgi:5'(3')-deoxyribonucleotidase
MIIGIDIDDTITKNCDNWFKIFNEKYKPSNQEPLQISDAYKWHFYDDWDKENRKKLFDALGDESYYDNLEFFPNAINTISKIVNSDNKVVLISSTYKEYQEAKKNWILEKIPILSESDIIFTPNKELINVDVMIDDNLDYAKKFKCPFLLFRRPWNTNRPFDEYTDNIINVANWDEIEKTLTKMGVINIEITGYDNTFTEATMKLINGIKEAKTDKECIDLLNPYIKMWQQQGILIGMKQINDATVLVVEDIIKEINEENKKM